MDRTGKPFLLKTSVGTFKASISPSYTINLETRKQNIVSYTITIGGKNQCVQIKVMNDTTNTTAELLSVKTSFGECEIYGTKIRSEKTIHMVLLTITLLRTEFSHINILKLLDTSSFTCEFENGSKQGVSLTQYEILFHDESWYEKRFGAELPDSNTVPNISKTYETYKKLILNFNNPAMKPKLFDFNNEVLNTKLPLLYNKTSTWREFLNEVYKLNNVCEVICPWYKNALAIIFNNISYDSQWWFIKLNDNPKIYPIPYELQPVSGGRRKGFFITRRNKSNYTEPLTYGEMYTLPYTNINFDKIIS